MVINGPFIRVINMKKLLLISFISLCLISCATNQMLDDGYFYKDIGVLSVKVIKLFHPKELNVSMVMVTSLMNKML